MTTSASTSTYKSLVLDYYYKRRAESSIGSGDRFEIGKAVFGTSSLVVSTSSGVYDLETIPSDFAITDMETSFCTVTPTLSYADGVITIRCDLDTTQLTEGKTYPFNTLALLDSAGVPIVLLCVQEDSLYFGKTYTAVMTLNTTDA